MAFLAFQDFGSASALRSSFAAPCAAVVEADEARQLSPLEWSVVAVARNDRPSTLRRPGRLGHAWRRLMGIRNPMLADPRLEALRRIAVLTWRRGYSIPPQEVHAFLAAGFTRRQYEKLADGIGILRHRNSGVALA